MGRIPDPADIYRAQTSMLQWLRRLGHRVDFSDERIDGSFEKDPPKVQYNGQPCPYCGKLMQVGSKHHPTRDHVRPRRAGGTLGNGNMLMVCLPCNGDKGDMMLREWLRSLIARGDPRALFVQKALDAGADPYGNDYPIRKYLPKRTQRGGYKKAPHDGGA